MNTCTLFLSSSNPLSASKTASSRRSTGAASCGRLHSKAPGAVRTGQRLRSGQRRANLRPGGALGGGGGQHGSRSGGGGRRPIGVTGGGAGPLGAAGGGIPSPVATSAGRSG
jgi:hypothetical protein